MPRRPCPDIQSASPRLSLDDCRCRRVVTCWKRRLNLLHDIADCRDRRQSSRDDWGERMPADLYTYARLSNDSYTPGRIKAPLPVLYEDRHENFAAKVYAGPSGAIIAYAGTDDARDALVEDAGGIGLLGN